jgi:FMN reductase
MTADPILAQAPAAFAPSGVPVRPVLLVGHPRAGSRTHAVARRAVELLVEGLSGGGLVVSPPDVVDLATVGPWLLDREGLRSGAGRDGVAALDAVRGRPLLVLATPTFRGAYSGLLKLFLDLLPRDGLRGTVVVVLATAGLPDHRRAVDGMLRPVLREMDASLPAPGICVLESELAAVDDVFAAWWAGTGEAVCAAVRARLGAAAQVRPC